MCEAYQKNHIIELWSGLQYKGDKFFYNIRKYKKVVLFSSYLTNSSKLVTANKSIIYSINLGPKNLHEQISRTALSSWVKWKL